MRAQILQAELLGEREGLAAELDRFVQPIAQHLVARHLGEHRDLDAGSRCPVDETPSDLELLQHPVATASLPRDVGQHQRRFGGSIAVAGSQTAIRAPP